MQGKFFGHQQMGRPCPHCGTPLIMADYDDSCYVFPGRLHKPCQWGQNGKVVVSVYARNPIWVHVIVRGVKKKDGITSIDATLDKFNFHIESPSPKEEFKKHLKGWERCPDCGAMLEFDIERKLGNVTTYVGYCPERNTREKIERLPGCKKCNDTIHGGHFMDLD